MTNPYTSRQETNSYTSRQDYATACAINSRLSSFMRQHLPRTMAYDSDIVFERYLHDSMGWKSSTVNDW